MSSSPSSLGDLLRSARFAKAFTLTTFAAAFGSFAIERLAGRVAYVTIIVGLCIIAVAMLVARRREMAPMRLASATLLLFLAWTFASAFWSTDTTKSLVGWIALVAYALLAVAIAQVRDTLQTVRALGDVMRWLLSISLGLEILLGILLDLPWKLLEIQGLIADFGPVQGIFGTRNALGFVAVIALITFLVEWRTASVRPGLAVVSVLLAGGLAVLSDSPTVIVIALIVGLAALTLSVVRHAPPASRPALQAALAGIVVVAIAVAFAVRGAIATFLGTGSDFATRAELWGSVLDYVRFRPVQGWGWFGGWSTTEFPFLSINVSLTERHESALNAYLDVMLQVGWFGLLIFLLFCIVALVRSWLEASDRRSVVYTWTPLVLGSLLIDSMFESFTLYSYGWMLLVLCATQAGQSRSWRDRMRQDVSAPPDLPERLPG